MKLYQASRCYRPNEFKYDNICAKVYDNLKYSVIIFIFPIQNIIQIGTNT